MVPDIEAVVPDLKPPTAPGDPDSGRFRLYDAFDTFLDVISREHPIVLILDDLHWADEASLRLLEFVVQEQIDSRILLPGTYRDTDITNDHSLFHTLGDLARSRLFSRVTLGGLDVEGVSKIIEVQTGANIQQDVSVAIHAQSEGNPLFVGEMARSLNQEGLLTGDTSIDLNSLKQRHPEGIREVAGRRLSRLSAYAKDVLTIAAFLGREFSLGQLSAISTEQSSDELIEVLGEALSARLIEELPSEAGGYQFTHTLIQQALREEL